MEYNFLDAVKDPTFFSLDITLDLQPRNEWRKKSKGGQVVQHQLNLSIINQGKEEIFRKRRKVWKRKSSFLIEIYILTQNPRPQLKMTPNLGVRVLREREKLDIS